MSQRTDRVDELLREEIGEILNREVDDPQIGFVTITEVETAPDLRHARVWASVIGQPTERQATLEALNRAMPFVRRELGRRLHMKRIPELHVRIDDSSERGTRVLHLLHELEQGNVPAEETPAGESLPTPQPRLPRPEDAPTDFAVDPGPPTHGWRRGGGRGPRGGRRASIRRGGR